MAVCPAVQAPLAAASLQEDMAARSQQLPMRDAHARSRTDGRPAEMGDGTSLSSKPSLCDGVRANKSMQTILLVLLDSAGRVSIFAGLACSWWEEDSTYATVACLGV